MAKRFNTEKDFLEGTAVADAPVVGGEFVTKDGEWQGQTIEVKSEKHLEDDHGTGEHVLIRTYEFATNPLAFRNHVPDYQDIFNSVRQYILSLLWQDGLTLIPEVDPVIRFSDNREKFFIMVTARPMTGQTVVEKTNTLSELINESKRHPDSVHRELQLPSVKKKKAKRATKAS